MDYNRLIEGIRAYGSTSEDIIKSALNIDMNQIRENVIISPSWTPLHLSFNANIECLNESIGSAIRIYNIQFDNQEATYIRTGIGAPATADIVLQLGLTNCKRVLVIGSVGAIDEQLNIGDILIPEYAMSGDGVCRYLTGDFHDMFGEKIYPDTKFSHEIYDIAKKICGEEDVKIHKANLFTVASSFSQFIYIDRLRKFEAQALDMESAAAFYAAKIAGISISGIFQVSDNIVENKSLYGGRTSEEMDYRRQVRKLIFPKIILSTLRCVAGK